MQFTAPVCFNTTYCGGESVSDDLLSFNQCCFELSGVSFASSGQCLLCPKGTDINVTFVYLHLQYVWYVCTYISLSLVSYHAGLDNQHV